MKWNKCEDELPKAPEIFMKQNPIKEFYSRDLLIITEDCITQGYYCWNTLDWYISSPYLEISSYPCKFNVTHWAEMPEIPERCYE